MHKTKILMGFSFSIDVKQLNFNLDKLARGHKQEKYCPLG